jgi:hypothetical protein
MTLNKLSSLSAVFLMLSRDRILQNSLEALGKFKMKINEVTVKEASVGQLWAGAKGAYQGLRAGGLGGIAAGARAGYQTAGAAQSQSKQIKDITTQVLQKWGAYNQKIKTSTGGTSATPQQAVAWLTQFLGGQKPASQPPGPNPNPAQIQQWLQKEVAGYMANQELPQQGAATQSTAQAIEPTAATQQPAGNLPDIGQLTKQELLQLKQQLQAA